MQQKAISLLRLESSEMQPGDQAFRRATNGREETLLPTAGQ